MGRKEGRGAEGGVVLYCSVMGGWGREEGGGKEPWGPILYSNGGREEGGGRNPGGVLYCTVMGGGGGRGRTLGGSYTVQ